MLRELRAFLIACAMGASAVITVWLAADFSIMPSATDAELVASFRGAAVEDVFGLGFWPTWLLITVAQLALVGSFVLLVRNPLRWVVAVALLGAFSAASYPHYVHNQRLESLWNTYISAPQR